MSTKPPARGLSRHLEGWQPALLSVFLAGSAAILAVPRSVDPSFLPIPMVDPRALARATALDDARATAAAREGLDVDIRKLGSAIRAYGLAESEGDEAELLKARPRLSDAAVRALEQGEEGVLRLRALSLRLFLTEVRRWEATGEETQDLRELGGGFLRMLKLRGWVRAGSSDDFAAARPGDERRILMAEDALRAAWKRRWNEITAIQRPSFALELDEQRALYRFFLTRPTSPPGLAASPTDESAYEDQYRLKKIDELAAIDAAYPKDLARGIVLYRLGRYVLAAVALRKHLEASPDGPFTLRARNYLRAALERARANDAISPPGGAGAPESPETGD